MATHHLKDVSILKTGTCQGTDMILNSDTINTITITNSLFHTAQFAKYETASD